MTATLRAEYPGWDYETLNKKLRRWLQADPARTPLSYQSTFIGSVRRRNASTITSLGDEIPTPPPVASAPLDRSQPCNPSNPISPALGFDAGLLG